MAEVSIASRPLHVRFGEFELDEANARLLRDGSAIALSPRPFGLLCALIRRSGALLTKHDLLDEVWGHRFVGHSVLKGVISDVRTVLDDDPQQARFIETVPRRGYRFIAAVTAIPPSPGAATAPEFTRLQVQPEKPSASALRSVAEAPRDSFVGRAKEVAALRRTWEDVTKGRCVMFWIAGEPGIGKTTLIEHFSAAIGEVTCARGRCVQHHGSGEPYHPVLDALAELCRTDESVPVLLRAVAPTWLLQLPWLSTADQREALLRELVGVNLERMLRELGEFLDRYTERQPLLLVTEDLHWADGATIQLIDYLARRRNRGRVMWLSSFRLSEVIASDHPLSSLRHELHLQQLCEEIVLDPFSETEVADYLVQRAPSMATNESFVRALHERTDGVPLFVASMTTDVAARYTGEEVPTAALLANAPVPEKLSAIIDRYAAKLESDKRLLLAAAAVCGDDFRIVTLARVLERDDLWIADVCEQLLREQLWLAARTQGADDARAGYSFRHALFREVLYERLAPSARAELHRKVGTVLEQERAGGLSIAAAELAMHFDRGRAPMAAARHYAEAAQTALTHLSPAEGMILTERALRLLEHAPAGVERISMAITLSTLRGVAALQSLGAGNEALSAYQHGASLLAEVPQHPMRGLLLHGLGFLLNIRAEYSASLATADRADALAADMHDGFLSLAANTVRGQSYMHQGRPEAARESLERALEVVSPSDTASEQSFIGFVADPQVTVLAILSLQLVHLGRVREARERLQQAYTRARRLAQPMALMITIWFHALCEIRFADVDRVAALADEMHALVEKFALAQGKTACRWFQGWAEARRGNPFAASHQIREACDENTMLGMIAGSSETRGYVAEALLLQGDINGADVQLQQAFEIVNKYGERIYLPQLLLTEAAIARARAQRAKFEDAIRRAIAEARAQGARWLELLTLTELCEHADPTAKDLRSLGALIDQLSEGAGDTPAFARARAARR